MMRGVPLAAELLVLAAALCGCRLPGGLRIWAADEMVHLSDRSAPAEGGVWDASRGTVSVFAAANETAGFQLVIDPGLAGSDGVQVLASGLAGPDGKELPEARVRLYRMLPVAVGELPAWFLRLAAGEVAPGRFYDPLVPLGAPGLWRPIPLAPGERLAVWADVHVPRDAPAGLYAAAITIRDSLTSRHVKVAVKVYDFVLPDARAVTCLGGFAHEAVFQRFVFRPAGPGGQPRPYVPDRLDTSDKDVRAGLDVVRKLMRLGRDHRLDLFDKTLHPILKREPDGSVRLLWDDYDAVVKPYLDGSAFDDRIGVSAWPAPFWSGWPRPEDYGGPASDDYRATAAAVAAASAAHFRLLGHADRLLYWPRTGGAGSEAYAAHAAMSGLIRSAHAGAEVLTLLPPAPPAETGWTVPAGFRAGASMFAPPAEMFDPGEAAGLAGKDRPLAGLWLRPGNPPYLGGCGVLASPADVRALAWVAMKYRCAGIFLPEVLNWAGPEEGANPEGDRLFYSGRPFGIDGPLPSVRLKRLRRGLQDAAYIWLLRQHRRDALAEAMIGTMVHYAGRAAVGDHYLDPRLDGWVRDGPLWTAAHQVLAEEVFAAVHPGKLSDRELLAQQLAWRRLQERASRLRLEGLRSRVEPLPGGDFRAILDAELFNPWTLPTDAELRAGPLPAGWRAVRGDWKLADMPPGGRAVAQLVAEGPAPPAGWDAKIKVPLTLAGKVGGPEEIPAAVPFLTVPLAPGVRLTIDGDLSDWPLRPGNAAAGFVLLGRRGRVGDGQARRKTVVLALHDQENLYLAFRCEEDKDYQPRARASNVVRYDQLLAAGEDMVEVIVDPGRTGQAAEDLYHLVVKSNGVSLTGRGVAADPPLGRWGPWPVRLAAAVASAPGLWTVELSIPLKDFGPGAARRTWGVNFTRFSTAERAASSWAGAIRYFYHPKNLGTMHLAE